VSGVTAPIGVGLHFDIPSRFYHADPLPKPSLSSGIVRTIRKLSLKHAKLEHIRLGGTKRKLTAALSLGQYVHGLVARDVSEFEVGDYASFSSDVAKRWMATVEALNKEPVLLKTTEEAAPIAQAVIDHAGDGLTLDPINTGHPEVTAVWREDDVWCRARYDRLVVDSYADVWDWKTTDDITDRGIDYAIAEHGYHIQAAFYLRGLAACLPDFAGRCTFTLVFVEKSPPYTVRRVKLSPVLLAIGKREVSRAIDAWRAAMASGEFPGFSVDTYEAQAPSWMDDDLEITTSEAA
jgi:hypothetical protein